MYFDEKDNEMNKLYLGLVHDANSFLTATGIAVLIGNTAASFGMNMIMSLFSSDLSTLKPLKQHKYDNWFFNWYTSYSYMYHDLNEK